MVWEKGKPLTINGRGEQTRDFIYVEDVAGANLKATQRATNETYNIGTGRERLLSTNW
ncbi:MAG: NAD-dependent epimerase/dehydratase family protein [Elusimicrobia bacterium]|nr:NAD-dependent epimerase/dehydratase family protein [Elusimicrobiota bacterium]